MPGVNTANDRRTAYRVRPDPSDALNLALITDTQTHVPREISDVTIKGASIRFAGSAAPRLGAGDRVMVSVKSPALHGDASVMARIVSSSEDLSSRVFGLLFEENAELIERGNQHFFRLFNRRVADRNIAPKPSGELRAYILPIGGAHKSSTSFAVQLNHVSTTGVRIRVDKLADAYLRERSQFQLSVSLPERRDKFTIATRVRYRTEDDGDVYYGCRFEWNPTQESLDALEDLAEYLQDQATNDAQTPPDKSLKH